MKETGGLPQDLARQLSRRKGSGHEGSQQGSNQLRSAPEKGSNSTRPRIVTGLMTRNPSPATLLPAPGHGVYALPARLFLLLLVAFAFFVAFFATFFALDVWGTPQGKPVEFFPGSTLTA